MKRIESLPRVAVACGFESPWFVVLVPVDAYRVERAAKEALVAGVTAIGRDRPELPGGLRVEVPREAEPEWFAACVASVAGVLDSGVWE